MSIKQTAGKILLSLYVLQLSNPTELEQTSVVFQATSDVELETDAWLEDILHSINDNDNLLYNSFNYLLEKGLIAKKNKKDFMGGLLLLGLHLTASGIDVIEGVEQGEEPQKIIKSLFNFNFSSKMTIDSLVKAEVGNIVGVGAAVGGKIDL